MAAPPIAFCVKQIWLLSLPSGPSELLIWILLVKKQLLSENRLAVFMSVKCIWGKMHRFDHSRICLQPKNEFKNADQADSSEKSKSSSCNQRKPYTCI